MRKRSIIAALFVLVIAGVSTITASAYQHKIKEEFGPDCTGRTHNPHKSNPPGGVKHVAVHGDTFCTTQKGYLEVETSLYRNIDGYLTIVAGPTSVSDWETKGPVDASPRTDTCISGEYWGFSYHEAMSNDGQDVWTAGTGNGPDETTVSVDCT